MSTPALLRLRESYPKGHISILCPEKLKDLWIGHRAIDEIITFRPGETIWGVARTLRTNRYDLALVFPNSFRSALEVFLAGIPVRVGVGGNGRGFLLNHRVPRLRTGVKMRKRSANEVQRLLREHPNQPRETYPAGAHHLYQYLHLLTGLGIKAEATTPMIQTSAGEISAFRQKFGIGPAERIVGLNPGAEYGPAKRWPQERFLATAKLLASRWEVTFLLFGGPGDKALAEGIAAGLAGPGARVINAAGQTTLRELCAGLAASTVLLTNDTGPMHLAAALGVPVVVPFGSTSPELTGPGLPGSGSVGMVLGKAPCAPCFRRECPIDFRCMTSITPEVVAQRLAGYLQPDHASSDA